ncbi:MAG: CPBP family intramembrane glutamic endopeptidase [Caldilineaceae bacterium]|nr:CPBP family intramembrane metalloprotease [Caldilineaceae bacterium]
MISQPGIKPFPQHNHSARLQAIFHAAPFRSALALFLVDLLLGAVTGVAVQHFFPQLDTPFVTMCVVAVVIAALLTWLGWWRVAGFNAPTQWRNLRLYWLPAVVAMIFPLFGGFEAVGVKMLLYMTLAYAITGFMEEAWMRGLILHILEPLGEVRAVLISALFFAGLHSVNFLFRSPAIVLAQMVGAFCFGLAFAVLRLRTGTIWFLVALHMIHDLLLHLSGFPTIPLNVVQDVVLLMYGVYLLYTSRKPRAYATE